MKKKTNSELVKTIFSLKKNQGWLEVAKLVSSATRKQPSINLDELNKKTKEGDTIVFPGKILSVGNLDKKIRVCALGFSERALEKMKEKKAEAVSILEEIKKNPNAKGIIILK